MENYICINGRKTELTKQQLKDLGILNPAQSVSPMLGLIEDLRGNCCAAYEAGEEFEDFGMKFKIIGFNHDKGEDDEDRNTATLMIVSPVLVHRMHSGSCPRGWIDSELREWANEEYFDSLPDGLKPLIVPTVRTTNAYNGEKYRTVDKLFLPTESELFGSAIYSPNECGERYEAFRSSKDRIILDENGNGVWHWTASAFGGSTSNFVSVYSNGDVHANDVVYANRVPLCFQIS